MPRTKTKATKRKTTKHKPAGYKAVARRATKKAAGKQPMAKRAGKAPARKAEIEKVAAQLKAATTTAVKEVFNKSEVLSNIAEQTGVNKKHVLFVFEALANIMHRHLRKGGPGEFTVPGLMKCTIKRKPPVPARKGINPFTGEEMLFKAKPARNVIKVRPLKKLKEMAE